MKHTSYIFMVIITQHNWLNFMSYFVYHLCRLEACMGYCWVHTLNFHDHVGIAVCWWCTHSLFMGI